MKYSQKILDSFKDEATELIASLNYSLVKLEKNKDDSELIDEIFRLAHSIKSSSALMGFDFLSDIAHNIEDLFGRIRNQELSIEKQLITILLEGSDILDSLLEDYLNNKTIDTGSIENYKQKLIPYLNQETLQQQSSQSSPKKEISLHDSIILSDFEKEIVKNEKKKNFHIYYIQFIVSDDAAMKYARAYLIYTALQEKGKIIKSVPDINLSNNDELFRYVQILFSTNLDSESITDLIQDDELKTLKVEEYKLPEKSVVNVHKMRSIKLESGIKLEVEELERIVELLSELVLNKNSLNALKDDLKLALANTGLYDQFNEVVFQIEDNVEHLQNEFMKARMVPIEHLFKPFFKYVRDTATQLNKEVELVVEGENTLIDRTMLDSLINPISHLIRNSLSHGIEFVGERKKMGKAPTGKIMLTAAQYGNNILIEISDDGRGIDLEKVREAAVLKNIDVSGFSKKDLLDIISTPGFSTDTSVSSLSGRGVGMDVVKDAIEKLHGDLSLKTEKNKGTTFSLTIPMTVSVIDSLLVKAGDNVLAVPFNFIDETFLLDVSDIKKGKYYYHYKKLPLQFLTHKWLNDKIRIEKKFVQAIKITLQHKTIGLIVDNILSEEQLVIKKMDPIFRENPIISGASLLGDGTVVFIVNILNILKGFNI